MHLLKLIRPARLALVALLALPFSLCPAQEEPTAPRARTIAVAQPTITVDFPGGPLSKLVASLAADRDAKLSIIQAEGLDPTLPAFSFSDVNIDWVIIALRIVLERQGYDLTQTGPGLAVLTRNERTTTHIFASLQLEKKLPTLSADDIIAAIKLGCEFAHPDGTASTLRFQYHPGTKLLFVAGNRQEVDVARQVFASLPDDPAKTPPPAADAK